ncbi:MAG: hypothetical protein AB8H80_13220 [Planctomycetota bacterium]
MIRTLACATALLLPGTASSQALEHVPADATTVIVAGDMLPHARALLDSPDVQRLLQALQPHMSGPQAQLANAKTLKAQLGMFADFVPTEIVFGCPTETIDTFYGALHAFVCAQLAQVASSAELDEKFVDAASNQLQMGLEKVSGLHGVLVATMRSERAADNAYDLIEGQLEMLADMEDMSVELGDGEFTLTVDWMSMAGEQVRGMLAAGGGELPEGLAPKISLKLVVDGAQLRFQFGEPAPGPLAVEKLGPLWTVEQPPLLFQSGTSTCADLRDELESFNYEMMASDSMSVAMVTAMASEQLERLGNIIADQQSAMYVEKAGLRFEYREAMAAEFAEFEVPPSSLVKALGPADDGLVIAMPFDEVMLAAMDASEGYESFPTLADFFQMPDSAVFHCGTTVIAKGAELRSLKAMRLQDMPWLIAAVVVRPLEPADGTSFMQSVRKALAADLEPEQEPWQARDLGLGVETFAIDAAKVVPNFAAMGLDADFQPHWFMVAGHLVLSTDAKLSSEIKARLLDAKAAGAAADVAAKTWPEVRMGEGVPAALGDGFDRWFAGMQPEQAETYAEVRAAALACVAHITGFDIQVDRSDAGLVRTTARIGMR